MSNKDWKPLNRQEWIVEDPQGVYEDVYDILVETEKYFKEQEDDNTIDSYTQEILDKMRDLIEQIKVVRKNYYCDYLPLKEKDK